MVRGVRKEMADQHVWVHFKWRETRIRVVLIRTERNVNEDPVVCIGGNGQMNGFSTLIGVVRGNQTTQFNLKTIV